MRSADRDGATRVRHEIPVLGGRGSPRDSRAGKPPGPGLGQGAGSRVGCGGSR